MAGPSCRLSADPSLMPEPVLSSSPFLARLTACLAVLIGLSGCDQMGIETPEKITARLEAEAKAIGSACRQSGRAIEDCYTLNPKHSKAAMFGGWREMDEYMRENKLEIVPAVVPRPQPRKARPNEDEEDTDADANKKPAHQATAPPASTAPAAAKHK